ncbi:PadR family transcriptional regulator [Protaetiibacter intestinalis]|uniref:PadR family transcriptional regulator n=1 Tax=Protaetiibacter intestinalis TaxID=2419774 RepID=A0A387BBC4_9MICO|nr:PadR family transcriptional regulator [Protaetiibacter intestinalis]AYF98446.1 PadR family transcriptional regulator [Protaetiibacter intestinalis]
MEQLSRLTPATADVLAVLLEAGEPSWGLRIVRATERPAGSVYPILERLERAGWISSAWEDDPERSGPRRRLYELTPDGIPAAQAAVAHVRRPRATASPSTVVRLAGGVA